MTAVGATRAKDKRGFWHMAWVAVVNGAEIQGVRFSTKEEAIAYAERVAEYEKTRKGDLTTKD